MVFLSKYGAWPVAFAIGAFIMVSLILYISVDSNARRRQVSYRGIILDRNAADDSLEKLKERIEALKDKAKSNTDLLTRLTAKVAKLADIPNSKWAEHKDVGGGIEMLPIPDQKQIPAPLERKIESRSFICTSDDLSLPHNASNDVQMLNVYNLLKFDNPDSGVWKQGWPIEYDKNKIRAEQRLEVVVIPHSHTDPGWLKTFEAYFEDQTKNILNFMTSQLSENSDMKFIYAEMSFFELWWSQQNNQTKEQVKKHLESGQLEIVTGGWVMTDEANSQYFSTVMELFEGHEFLQNQLDYVPRNHWSIDPFGLSPTMAYILNRANLSNMAIQRVHYSVKKYLAQKKQLEFVWRQLFAGTSTKTDILTHLFPFYSYDAPHSCGPDPMVCCQFDFRRMSAGMYCPWGKNPVPVGKENVAERAELLADQYWKKAQLYGFNTILVPLGDDFRYEVGHEWADQYSNYKKLFAHMNARDDLNIHARFGTLADYFDILRQRVGHTGNEKRRLVEEGRLRHSLVRAPGPSALPTLSGDFFTYADRDDHYWSGYFTSRPFYKHMDRSLQHFLRAADIFFSLANWKGEMPDALKSLYNVLVSARRSMSLFQHHDGVTGTARTHVMTDYGEKMAQALADSKRVIAQSAEFLLNISTASTVPGAADGVLRVNEQHFVNRLPEQIGSRQGSLLVVANPLGHPREEVVCLQVDNENTRIGRKGMEIRQQIGPIFFTNLEGNLEHFHDKFELCFLATLPPLGLVQFGIIQSAHISHKVKITAFNAPFESSQFDLKTGSVDEEVVLRNDRLSALFNPSTGYLKSIRTQSEEEENISLSFVRYGARPRNSERRDGGDSLSGAYLFLPDAPATELPSNKNSFVLVQGPVRQYVHVKGPAEIGMQHRVSLDANADFLSILNTVDLGTAKGVDRGDRAKSNNLELAMRLRAASISEDNFFTDLNGFQMIRRRRQSKLPLQAQFYPMPGSAFIQDSRIRVSLLGRQALGVASLENGEMQVMLDRRLIQDDDRGLAQTVEDNLLTESRFRLLIEHFVPNNPQQKQQHQSDQQDTVGFHSMAAHHTSLQLHYGPILLIADQPEQATSGMVATTFSPLAQPFPCDVHPVAFRTLSEPTVYGNPSKNGSSSHQRNTLPKREAALVLHRLGLECALGMESPIANTVCSSTNQGLDGKLELEKIFANSARAALKSTLTLLYSSVAAERSQQQQPFSLEMDPMELATVKLVF